MDDGKYKVGYCLACGWELWEKYMTGKLVTWHPEDVVTNRLFRCPVRHTVSAYADKYDHPWNTHRVPHSYFLVEDNK